MTRIRNSIRTSIAVALALGAFAASTAQASGDVNATTPAPPVAIRVVRVADHARFDWTDAGIGAAGAAAVIAIGAGMALAAGGSRSRRTDRRSARVT